MSNKAGRRQRAHDRRLARGLEKTFRHNMWAQQVAFAKKLAEAEYIVNGGDPASPYRPAGAALRFLYAPVIAEVTYTIEPFLSWVQRK